MGIFGPSACRKSESSKDYNHDGKAFEGHAWVSRSQTYDDDLQHDQTLNVVAEYKTNVKSGKWKAFKNGE